MKKGKRIELRPNGDPFGSGFVAIEYESLEHYKRGSGVYLGHLGAQSRSFWRNWARGRRIVVCYE